jgi:hypothetical protein
VLDSILFVPHNGWARKTTDAESIASNLRRLTKVRLADHLIRLDRIDLEEPVAFHRTAVAEPSICHHRLQMVPGEAALDLLEADDRWIQ